MPPVTADPLARLQTAAALENTAVLAYTALLDLEVVTAGDPSVRAVLSTALSHHAEHAAAFQAAAVAAGGAPQVLPEDTLLRAVRALLPAVLTLPGALAVAELVESRLTATYVADAAAVGSGQAAAAGTSPAGETRAAAAALRTLYVATAGVEAQHTTFLRIAAAATASALPLTTRLQLRGAGALPALAAGAPVAFATTAGATDAAAGAVG